MAAVTICSDFGAQENKVCHCFHCFPIYLSWSDETGYHDFVFWMLRLKPAFSLSSFTFIKRLFSSSLLSTIQVVSSAYLRLLVFLLTILILALSGLPFYRKRTRSSSSSFLNRHHTSIISSSSRLGRGVFFVLTWSSQDCKGAMEKLF